MSTPDLTDKNNLATSSLNINDRIFVFQDLQVMVDKDLAEL